MLNKNLILVTQLQGVHKHLEDLQKMYSAEKNLIQILLTENILPQF